MNKIELKNIGKIIAVVSGKGGTGKSTLSTLLALSLAAEGKNVGLLDIDVHGPNIPLMLGVERKTMGVDHAKRLLPVKAGPNLKVVSTSFMFKEDQALIWRGPLKSNLIKQVLKQTDWGSLDFLIVDNPPGTGDEIITLTQLIDLNGVIVVGTPQTASVYDVRKAINMMKTVNVQILGLVENMSYCICPHCKEKIDLFGKGRIKQLAKEEKISFLGEIPIDIKLREMTDKGNINLNYLNPKIKKTLDDIIKNINNKNF